MYSRRCRSRKLQESAATLMIQRWMNSIPEELDRSCNGSPKGQDDSRNDVEDFSHSHNP